MTLTTGTRLGPYEVQSRLGAGGMGEVYRARDTRLDRTVAVKVLSRVLAQDEGLRERLEREARAVAALSHPHICALFDVGSEGDVRYLVMEHLEGETLAARLARGALPLDQALTRAIEIADALGAAHAGGIVHRDLKPSNVMLTRSGAKLLDFGLAKLQPAVVAAGETVAASGGPSLTGQGTILGTLEYMAPEQVEGREADTRTDIFAFGVLLYEMLSGRKAFEGRSPASLIAAILERDPPALSIVQPIAPPALDRVIRGCLEKDPDARWQSARDIARELRWIAAGGAAPSAPAGSAPRRVWRERALWGAALVATALAGGAAYTRRSPPPIPPVQFTLMPPPGGTFAPANSASEGPSLAISPDGRTIAFVAAAGSATGRLWLRELNDPIGRPLTGTDGAAFPFWSPDSRSIGFFADGKLKRVGLDGSVPLTLAEAPDGRGGTWSRDDVIVFAPHPFEGLVRVAAAGGATTTIARLRQGDFFHRFPAFLPDGRRVIVFVQTSDTTKTGLYLADVNGGALTFVVNASAHGMYVTPRHLLYVRWPMLVAQPFDPDRAVTTGEAVPVLDRVASGGPPGYGNYSASDGGTLVYASFGMLQRQLTWYGRDGRALETVGEPGDYANPALSADGRRLAVDATDSRTGQRDLWVFDLTRRLRTRLTSGPHSEISAVWLPDGRSVAYRESGFDGTIAIQAEAAPARAVLRTATSAFPTDRTADGRTLLFHYSARNESRWDIGAVRIDDAKPQIQPQIQTAFQEYQAQLSPDERWLAYASDESGAPEVYVGPFGRPSAGAGTWRVSDAGGSQPRWSRDGRELFYIAPDRRLMAVRVRAAAGSFETDAPQALFATHVPPATAPFRFAYVVAPDAKRFLVVESATEGGTQSVNVVVNWTRALLR